MGNRERMSDITLLSKLSSALSIDTNMLLDGEIRKNRTDTGKMKSIRFFICPECGSDSTR